VRRAPLYALFVADAISLVGNVVAQLAIPWFVLVTTGSATRSRPAPRPRYPLGVLLGGVIVGAIGVAATFLGIGLCYLVVTVYGFFNPAFRAMDRRRPPAHEHAGQQAGLGEHSGG
jgi:hypothetical protein